MEHLNAVRARAARLLFCVCLAPLALGAARADPLRDALTDVAKCTEIAAAGERLQCFDAAAARGKSALAAPPQAAREERSLLDWFGFARPAKPVRKPEEFGKTQAEDPGKELNEITAGVRELAKTSGGKAIFFLDNGQTWRQIDADSTFVVDPPAGTKLNVTIERGWLNSYNLIIDGRNGLIKVNRLY
jgi:hypothetical protein